MAKIIATAGVRLKIEGAGLAANIRLVLQSAISEASKGLGKDSTKGIEDDADRTSKRVKDLFKASFQSVKGLAASLGNAVLSGSRLLLMGAAAGGALTAVSSLSAGLIALVGAAAQAGAAVGILPAALAAVKAVTFTVQLGLKGMSEAFKAIAEGDGAAFNEALKRLSPSARDFARSVNSLKPEFDKLQLGVQERLFAGLGEQVKLLGKQYLPVARSLFQGLATSINATAKEVFAFIQTKDAFRDVATTTGNIKSGFEAARTAAVPFTQAILAIVAAGSTQLPRLGEAVGQVGSRFAQFISGLAASGRLEEIFSRALDVGSQLGRILGNLGTAIGAVFSAGQAQGAGLLNSLERISSALVDLLKSTEGQEALASFFEGIGALTTNVLPIISQLALAIGGGLAPIVKNLADGIGPGLLALFSQLNGALTNANPGITALGQAFGKVLGAMAPLLPAIGTLVGQLAGLFAQALTAILPTLTSFIEKITSSPGAFAGFAAAAGGIALVFSHLAPIFSALAPFVDDLLTKFGGVRGALTALTGPVGIAVALFLALLTGSEDFRNAIGGLLKTVGQLVGQLLAALMPAISAILDAVGPLIAQLGTALAPVINAVAQILSAVLTPVIAALVPIVNALIPVFNQVVQVVSLVISILMPLIDILLNILMPTIQALLPVVTTVFGAIAEVIKAALQIISGVIDVVIGVITGDWDRAWSGIVNIVSGAWNLIKSVISGALSIIGSVFSGAWNALVAIVTGAWAGIRQIVSTSIGTIVDFVSGLGGRILGALGNFGSLLYNAGRDLLSGLLNGITSMVGNLIAKAKEIGGNILGGVKSALGISSPSKEMAKLGVFAGEGLVIGLASMTAQIAAAAEAAGQTLLAATSTGVSTTLNLSSGTAPAPSSSPAPVVFQQTNIQQPGVDAKQFADYTSRNQAYSLSSAGSLRSVQLGPVQQGMQSNDRFVGVGGGL